MVDLVGSQLSWLAQHAKEALGIQPTPQFLLSPCVRVPSAVL